MKKAAIYVRSSKDIHDVSCAAQEEQLKRVVKENGEQIYHVFCDKALSSTRDVRDDFEKMVALGTTKNPPFEKIYCLDTSRFGRNQHQTQALLWTLRKKHGIEVNFINMPKTGTYMDPVFETIMSSVDELHSLQSKAKGVEGMKQNVRSGYRAGGQAPYGYRLVKQDFGKHRDGSIITKSKLEPDPETSHLVQELFLRRAKGEARISILDDFYSRGIPSPSGLDKWGSASAKSIEDNVDVYLGHTIFNKLNERIKEMGRSCGYLHGQKWRPREEWVINENTHEPLITQEIADKIRGIKEKGLRDAPSTAKNVYAMSGIMKCGICGTNYTGDRGIYGCNSKTKPGERCPNNDISQNKIEDAVFTFLSQKVLNINNVKDFIARIKNRFHSGKSEVQPLEKQFVKIDNQIRRVMKLYRMEAINDDEIEAELVPLQEQKKAIEKSLEDAKSSQGALEVSDNNIMEVIEHFTEKVSHADPKIRKSAVRALFQEITIFPKEGNPWERLLEIKGIYLPLTRVKVASPTGFEPVLPA